jgi:Asp/Glu/hydantoin racemase
MAHRLAFIHTVPSLVEPFNALVKEILPADVEVFHIADEMLLKVVLNQGGLSPFIHQRVAEHVVAAERAGATAVQLTCSSISPCADSAAHLAGIPIFKIDAPMVEQAIALGSRIGVAATAPTTLGPTSDLIRARAAAARRDDVRVESLLVEGAYRALFAGDRETHDRLVRAGIQDLASRNDVVLLAQASMARVVEALPPEERKVPILTSPRAAVQRLREALQEDAA